MHRGPRHLLHQVPCRSAATKCRGILPSLVTRLGRVLPRPMKSASHRDASTARYLRRVYGAPTDGDVTTCDGRSTRVTRWFDSRLARACQRWKPPQDVSPRLLDRLLIAADCA